jgi:hypothetical protein
VLVLESTRRTSMMGLRYARTDTTHTIPIPAHRMATTVRSGLTAEYLSVPVRGITGAGDVGDTGVAADIGVVAATGVRDGVMVMPAGTDAAMPGVTAAAVTDAAMPVPMLAAAMAAVTPAAVDSMVAERSAAAGSTVVVAAGSTVAAAVDSTVVVDTAADIGN